MTVAEKLSLIAENEQRVYDKGYSDGQAQSGGANFQDFVDAQTGLASGRKDLGYCFQYSDHEELNIKNETIAVLGYCFRRAQNLKKITFLPNATSKCTSFGYAFNNTPALETIENLDLTSATSANQTFNESKVKHITLTGTISFNLDLRALSELTRDSLLNVFNALTDKTGAESGTLYIGGTNLVKVSEEELAIATNKNWGIT